MNDEQKDQPDSLEQGPLSIEQVLAQLFETVAVTQAQNDVLLGLLTGLVSSVEEIDEEEVIQNAGENFAKHYERRIEQMKSEYAFFGGQPNSSPSSESEE